MKHGKILRLLALVLSARGVAEAADTLPGRLFFTAAERRMLEHARQHPEPANAPAADTPPEAIRFDGMVWHKDGLVALWIDRNLVPADRHLRPDPETGQLQVIGRGGQVARLDAGEQWSPTGVAVDRPPIRITHSRPESGR